MEAQPKYVSHESHRAIFSSSFVVKSLEMRKRPFNLRSWHQPLGTTTYPRRPYVRFYRALAFATVCLFVWYWNAEGFECARPGVCSRDMTMISSQAPSKIKARPLNTLVLEATRKLLEQHLLPTEKDDSSSDSGKAQLIIAPEDLSRFPSFSKHIEVREKADTLPDIIYIPFEESTADVSLAGWEDQWFSDAEFNPMTVGTLQEPKIDIVYTCIVF